MGKLKDLARESIHGKKHEIFRPKEYHEKTDAEKAAEKEKRTKRNANADGSRNVEIGSQTLIIHNDVLSRWLINIVSICFICYSIYDSHNGESSDDDRRIMAEANLRRSY